MKLPQKNTNFFFSPHAPYYITAPNFRKNSGGIRALYQLCHVLNELGYEAYIASKDIAGSDDLRIFELTETIKNRHRKAGRPPIAVYPEVIKGNPLNAPVVARWLLNKPGHLGGDETFSENDLIFYWDKWVGESLQTGHQLNIPIIDPRIFHNKENQNKRQGFCYYANKYQVFGGQVLPDIIKNGTSLGQDIKRTPLEIADVLRSSRVLYCYEPSSIVSEALFCGCPVILVGTPYLDNFDLGKTGLTVIPESEIQTCPDQIPLPPADVSALDRSRSGMEEVKRFIAETQACANALSADARASYCSPALFGHGPDPQYNQWRTRKSLQEIDGQLFAERMVKWKSRPLFNVVIQAHFGEETLLADSLDSIAAQWYPDWHLTLVAEFPASSPELTEIPQVSWIQCAPNAHAQAIDELIDHLPGDWLLFLDAGCTLEPHALLAFGDTINLAPRARLIYCDEDQCGPEQGSFIKPRFKPDFNLEMLRAMYYIGTGFAVHRPTFDQMGRLDQAGTAGLMGLCLKVAEHFAAEHFVHLPEILLHTPKIGLRAIDPDAEQHEVRAHLARLGIDASVSDGLVTGTQAVRYAAQGTALVSIIIPSREQAGYLTHCIESLLEQTRYPHFEIIVVAHQTRDPDALDYFKELEHRPELAGRLQILRNEQPFNYAALCNQGAAAAKGEYLLFLDNDTEFIQPNWLDNLVGQIQQKQVAAVSPRLSCPDGNLSVLNQTPRILGLTMLAGPFAAPNTSIVEPGYFGNLQVAQEVSALSGSCLLVRANLFDEAGRFDEIHTPIHEPVLDLCLRLRQAAYRLIWTPWVDVIHRFQTTRKRLATTPESGREIESVFAAERDYLLKTYLPQLANDPYYHRHLSLQQPYGIEPHAVIDWDTRFHDRLRVLGTPLTSASGEYRMVAPFRALQKAGIAQCCYVHPIGNRQQRVLNPIELARAAPDTLMVQQAIDDTQLFQMRQYKQYNSHIFITYAVDDIIGNLPKKHYLYNFQIREGKSRLREALAQADRLIASTEPIADFCRDMIGDIVVVPNRLEGDKWLPLKSLRRAGQKPRVGWAGAQQHLGDLELMKEVVEATHQEVEWVFMGMCPDFLKPYVHEEHAFVNIADYPAKLASLNLDVAIAPLEQVIFNEGKSNLRLLEYGIMGWPVVCTDVFPYQTNNAPVKRVQNVATDWIKAIRERVHDLDAAAKEGDALRAWVLKHYILEDHLASWLKAVTPR